MIKDFLTHTGIAALAVLLFWLFIYLPDIKKAKEEYAGQIETVYIAGKDSATTRDTTISAEKPVVTKEDTSVNLITLASSLDTSIVLGKDTLNLQATVGITVNKDSLLSDHFDIVKDLIAKWFINLDHRDFTPIPDTVKVYYPKIVEKEIDIAWYRTDTFAYIVSGIIYLLSFLNQLL